MEKYFAKGFTLIEVMIVIVIVGILASIAYPSYMNTVRKTNRSDGISGLMGVIAKQERYYTENNSYTTGLWRLGYGAQGTTVYTDERKYILEAATTDAENICNTKNLSNCVTIIATAQGDQTNDKANGTTCSPLKITSEGKKTPSDCW